MSIWRRLPPLTALRAFAAFAEAGTLERAGAQIGVTHAAVSQQIRALEAWLHLSLVERGARGLALTAEGRLLAAALRDGFGTIAAGVDALSGAEANRPLHISTTPAFAGGWLLPRLATWRQAHPGLELMVDASPDLREIGPGGVDAAIRFGNGDWPGLEARLLVASSVVVVAAPVLAEHAGDQSQIAGLVSLPWLQEMGTSEASGLFRHFAPDSPPPKGVLSLPGTLLLDAARDGQGVAAVARVFVAADIAAGRLRVLFEDQTRQGYFLLTRPGVQRPAVRAFAQWIQRQASSTATMTARPASPA